MTQQLLVDQNAALLDFLDDLLTESAEDTALAGQSVPEPAMSADAPAPAAEPVSEGNGPGLDKIPATEPPAAHVPENDSVAGRVPIIPDWGAEAFQAMVFKVGDLSLAIPLVELAGVVEWRPELVDKTGATGFRLGCYPHSGQSVTLIDTARFIFPAERLAALYGPDTNSRLSRIILIDKGNIGLACDEVYEVFSIQPELVNWRSEQTRRQWLAGTMLEQLIAVLDARATAELLVAGRNNSNE